MRKFKSPTVITIVFLFVSFSLTSCRTTKTNVGAYKETEGQIYTYAKGKQVWLFWGFLPAGRTSVNTPGDGNCKIITRVNLTDVIISTVTAGIVTTQTIKVKAKRI